MEPLTESIYSCRKAAGQTRAARRRLPILERLDEGRVGLHAGALTSEINNRIVQGHVAVANEVGKDDSCAARHTLESCPAL